MLNPLDTDALREQFGAAKPFPFVVIEDFIQDDLARKIASEYPSFEQAANSGRQFSNLHERFKVQITDEEHFPPTVAKLYGAISSPEFLRQVSEITGIENLLADDRHVGGGMHIHETGGALDVHVDFNVLPPENIHRRLNIITYLNPEWRDEWDGSFEVWDEDVTHCSQRVLPKFNRCVIFRTSETSFHGVAATHTPPGILRQSFSAFYYTAEPPPWWNGVAHDTIYRARPSERMKQRVQMPLLAAKRRWEARKKATKQRIKGWLRGSS